VQGKFAGDVALHRAAVANGKAAVNLECLMRDALCDGECAWFRRAVRRVKNSAFLVYRNSVRNRSSVDVAGDGAKESRAQWRSNFVHLNDLETQEIEVSHPAVI